MEVRITKVSSIQSRHGGEVLRIDGFHVNEFGEEVKGYTFIDPDNDNAPDWADVIEAALANRGRDIRVDGVRMKNREKGLWSADCKPYVLEILERA
jgi:hypothetical protein